MTRHSHTLERSNGIKSARNNITIGIHWSFSEEAPWWVAPSPVLIPRTTCNNLHIKAYCTNFIIDYFNGLSTAIGQVYVCLPVSRQ